jgi:hypothetical protein
MCGSGCICTEEYAEGIKRPKLTQKLQMQVLHQDVKRVFTTCLLVSAMEACLLLASAVFLVLPFTIPQLVCLQLAVPITLLEGTRHLDAIRVSRDRIHGFRGVAALALSLVRESSGQRNG